MQIVLIKRGVFSDGKSTKHFRIYLLRYLQLDPLLLRWPQCGLFLTFLMLSRLICITEMTHQILRYLFACFKIGLFFFSGDVVLWEVGWHLLELLFNLFKLPNLSLLFSEFCSFVLTLQLLLLLLKVLEHLVLLLAELMHAYLLQRLQSGHLSDLLLKFLLHYGCLLLKIFLELFL